MTYKLVFPFRLQSLNEYIAACRKAPVIGANMKKADEKMISIFVREQMRGVQTIKEPVRMHYTWYEANARRDLDNVSSYGRKVIQDALVRCGVLSGDGPKQVVGFSDTFAINKDNPHIEVIIEGATPQ